MGETLDFVLWDRKILKADTTRFFDEALGQQTEKLVNGTLIFGIKSWVETNIDTPHCIYNKRVKITSIGINLIAKEYLEHEWHNIINNSTFIWKIVDQPILKFPLNLAKIRRVAKDPLEIKPEDDEVIQNKVYKLAVPVMLNPYENFNVDIINNSMFTTSQPYAIQVAFMGLASWPR